MYSSREPIYLPNPCHQGTFGNLDQNMSSRDGGTGGGCASFTAHAKEDAVPAKPQPDKPDTSCPLIATGVYYHSYQGAPYLHQINHSMVWHTTFSATSLPCAILCRCRGTTHMIIFPLSPKPLTLGSMKFISRQQLLYRPMFGR